MTSATRGEASRELGEILDRVDIEYWLNRECVEYKVTRGSHGMQLNLKECPACGNSNWKVYINQETGLGNCFHGDCEAKFSKWSFVRASLGDRVTNKDVVEHLKAVASEQGWQPKRRETLARPNNGSLKLPGSHELPIKGANLKYLDQRGIDIETAKAFELRYCHDGMFIYFDADGQKRRQLYNGRIIIPVRDLNGRLVSYQGRDITGTAEKKYLFPPGFASTGAYLYNGNNAYGYTDVVMGEGAFDVMAIYQAFKGDDVLCNVAAIGSFGKHLSHGDEDSQFAQLMKLQEAGLSKLTIMWDGEAVAIRDAIEAGLMIKRCGIEVRLAILPAGKDPNEVPPEVVREVYREALILNDTNAITLKLKYGVR